MNSIEKLNGAFERCAAAFQPISQSATGQGPCYTDEEFRCAKTPVSDRVLLQRVTALFEESLTHAKHAPRKEAMKCLRDGVREFIRRSEAFSLDEKENGLEILYLDRFLLDDAIEEKLAGSYLLLNWTHKALANSPSAMQTLLDQKKKVVRYNASDMERLCFARNAMYSAQKTLSICVEFLRKQNEYFTAFSGFDGTVKPITKASLDPSTPFSIIFDTSELFNDIASLGLRMRTERILREAIHGTMNDDNALLDHIKLLLDAKRRYPSTSAAVHNCLHLLRCEHLTKANMDKSGSWVESMFDNAIQWITWCHKVREDERSNDPLLATSITVGIVACNMLAMGKFLSRIINERNTRLYLNGRSEEVGEGVIFQQQKQKIAWRMAQNLIKGLESAMKNDTETYRKLNEKMKELIRLLPSEAERQHARKTMLSTFEVCLKDQGEKEIFSDLEPKEYTSRLKRLLDCDTIIVSHVDELIERATLLLKEEDEAKQLALSLGALSVQETARRPRAEKPRQKPQGKPGKKPVAKKRVIKKPVIKSGNSDQVVSPPVVDQVVVDKAIGDQSEQSVEPKPVAEGTSLSCAPSTPIVGSMQTPQLLPPVILLADRPSAPHGQQPAKTTDTASTSNLEIFSSRTSSPLPPTASPILHSRLAASPAAMAKRPLRQNSKFEVEAVYSPFRYHKRVTRWWDPKRDPFIHDPAYGRGNFSREEQAWIRIAHNFGRVVDQFAKSEGIIYGDHIALIGEIIMNGEKRRGVFGYAFDRTGSEEICYHRCFTRKTENDIVNEYAEKGFYDLEFPPLEPEPPPSTDERPSDDDDSFVHKITDRVTIVNDPKNKAIINICRFIK